MASHAAGIGIDQQSMKSCIDARGPRPVKVLVIRCSACCACLQPGLDLGDIQAITLSLTLLSPKPP